MVAIQKRWPVSCHDWRGVKQTWFVKNGAWNMRECTKFPNYCETFLAFPEKIHCIKKTKKTSKLVAKIFANKSGFVPDYTLLNLGLCAACWARSMCHHELWPISVSHPFSFLNNNSSLGLVGAKHYQKITIPILRLFFLFCCSRLISQYCALSLLVLLTLFWLGFYCSMWLYFTPGLVKVL